MNQIAMERVNEQVATRSASNDHMNVVKAQPLDGRDELGLDQGHLGANLDPRSVRFELREEEDGGTVGEGNRVNVDGTKKVGEGEGDSVDGSRLVLLGDRR